MTSQKTFPEVLETTSIVEWFFTVIVIAALLIPSSVASEKFCNCFIFLRGFSRLLQKKTHLPLVCQISLLLLLGRPRPLQLLEQQQQLRPSRRVVQRLLHRGRWRGEGEARSCRRVTADGSCSEMAPPPHCGKFSKLLITFWGLEFLQI